MSYLIHQKDEEYNSIYREALEATQMEHSDARHARFYNMIQFLKQTQRIPGFTAECGCWRGLSSYMILESLQRNKNWRKRSDLHQIFDSFQGLSKPQAKDIGEYYSKDEIEGRFAASMELVKNNLKKFCDMYSYSYRQVQFYKGWIPQVFDAHRKTTSFQYRFVHIDVELYEPTYASLEFFWERMSPGGIIVCDDCGYLSFPGSNRAMRDFCEAKCLQPLFLTTGNGVLIKR